MSDIFLSYNKADKAQAELFAKSFEASGWTVFWDKHIPPGKTFDHYIGEQLDAAKCIVVLWSETSVKSDWVRDEAQRGLNRGNLVPALIGPVSPPLGFGRIEAALLADWSGDPKHPEFENLLAAITALLGKAGASPAPAETRVVPPPHPAAPASRPSKYLWMGTALLLGLSALGILGYGANQGWFSGESKTDPAGAWGVVFGSDTSLDAAGAEISRAQSKGLRSTGIYLRNDYYASIALADSSETAGNYLAMVKAFRPDAYIARMDTWCINPKPDNGFIRCMGK